MGIAYRHDSGTDLTVVVWDGDISTEQTREHIAALAADPYWPASRLLITDLTTVSAKSRPTADQVAQTGDVFLRQLESRVATVKWAMIADQLFEEALSFEGHIEHKVRRMLVFNNLRTACVWMELDASDVQIVVDDLRQQLRANWN